MYNRYIVKKRVFTPLFLLIIKKGKNMEEKTPCNCPECERREQEEKESEEMGMALLIALIPLMTITLFSNIGLL